MFKKFALVGLALVLALALPQTADARPFADIYVECGLGALIAPNTPVVAVITNITWDLGTTAISSDLSSPESCKGGQVETAKFINDAYDEIEADLAAGSGEHLDVLATLAGFEADDAGREAFLVSLREDFAAYVAQWDYPMHTHFQKSESLYDMVYANLEG